MKVLSGKLLGSLALAGAVAAGGSAFTASNTMTDQKMGQGVADITGYAVSGASYTYDTDGLTILTTTFTLDGTADLVKARVLDGSVTPLAYVVCAADTDTDAAGPDTAVTNQWHCDVIDVLVSDAVGLDVYADDSTVLP